MLPHRHQITRRGGRTIVELALILNLLLLVVLGVFEYGHIIMIRQLMDEAARSGARLAVVSTNTYPATTLAQIQSNVTTCLSGQSLNNLVIQAYQADTSTGANIGLWSSTPFGSDIAVQIDGDYQPMVPTTLGILPTTLHLTAKSVMRSEAN